ncbi:relaxase/mobilization nuclease domain-containing protein [Spirosoma foliorum]|uniref:Relaxase/mobilization nuclease domain-containing protein n=1 Tax=Spirosoma foliorum TaxID=2710596 RepID=A0A7G5H2Q8_9BACT|nr:relaxase/mobilization nuclease domain-containing protein [Spirosoma foliorum]QMW05400.1 relaxase/mobilization nuclease domain-containing protein [Spirosoma foliorum]
MAVIRGKARGDGKQLARYLLAQRDNDEKPQLLQMRGFADTDPVDALVNATLDAAAVSRSSKPFYHGIINPREGEAISMTAEQWEFSADMMEKHLQYEGLPRMIVRHQKGGRAHIHVVWFRYDYNTGKLRSDTYNFYKHNAARFEIEKKLGHEHTNARRDRTQEPSHKQRLTELWRDSSSAADFVSQAQAAGYEIAQGLDRHPYRVITPEGTSIDLVRQLDGYRKRDVYERFKRYDLPTEAQALKSVQARSRTQNGSNDVFQQLKERDRRGHLMQEGTVNSDTQSYNSERDIFEQLKDKQVNQTRKRDRGLER